MRLTAKLPIVLTAHDYHYFDTYKDVLSEVLGKGKINYMEVGFVDGAYHAVYWHGKKTLAVGKMIREMMEKCGEE